MATEADIQAWTAASGRDWDQMCEAYISNLCAAFGNLIYYPASAIDAYHASHIESHDAYTCPPGGIVWLDIGTYGHVQLAVEASHANGTSRLQTVWGTNAGLSDLAWYCAQTGARPLGWSWDNAGSRINYESPAAPSPTPETETESEDDMPNWNFVSGASDRDGVYIVGPKGSRHLSPQEYDLLKRLRITRVDASGKVVSPPGGVHMNGAEMEIASKAIAAVC